MCLPFDKKLSMINTFDPDYSLFRQPPTYATFLKNEIEWIMATPGFETLRFYSVKAQGGYDSVLAVGYDANGQVLLPTSAPLLLDNVPCPPECHIRYTTNFIPAANLWLPLVSAQQIQQEMPLGNRFAVSFPKAMMEDLLSNTSVGTIKVYYASLNGAPTFLVRRADSNGGSIADYYLLDSNPVSPAVL